MKVSAIPAGRVVAKGDDTVEVEGDGETAIYRRSTWEKMSAKQWNMEDAYVHISWRSVPAELPLVCRLWLWSWMQHSLRPNEPVALRHSALAQWGFAENKETIRKAAHRMEKMGLAKLIREGKKQLKIVLLMHPSFPPPRRTVVNKEGIQEFLRSIPPGDVVL